MQNKSIFWFRRDLRLFDNAGLYHALRSGDKIVPIFIFDSNILDELSNKKDPRVNFIHDAIKDIDDQLKGYDSGMQVYYGDPSKVWSDIIKDHKPRSVYTNRDYEPYALQRDKNVKSILENNDSDLLLFKDHVIFDHHEITKDDGEPYSVYTPYKKKWLARLDSKLEDDNTSYYLKEYPCHDYYDSFAKMDSKLLSLAEIGFESGSFTFPDKEVKKKLIKDYADKRDYPSREGTSKLGVHFRFGTISIRQKARKARTLSDVYLSELIWRDFYSMILYHHPKVVNTAYREKYDKIEWRNNEREFDAWKEGKTGYALVDAGMRELNTTGYMHNRVRMLVASFLTKHLLIDWRWGEAYFAEKLLDYDLASNNGGWQWAAGCGTDAAPYFRIFNPMTQLDKFDKDRRYVNQFVEEYGTEDYPDPIVDHKEARERCLQTYKAALG